MSDSTAERLASHVLAPKRGQVYGGGTSTSDVALDLNQTVGSEINFFRGRFVTIQALSADLYYQLTSSSGHTIDPATAAGAVADAVCVCVPAGQERSFFVPDTGDSNARYLIYRTASGSGSMRLWASSPKMHGGQR